MLAALPLHDWQFWVVSAIALCAAAYIVATVTPKRWRFWSRRAGASVSLTVGGKAVDGRSGKRPHRR